MIVSNLEVLPGQRVVKHLGLAQGSTVRLSGEVSSFYLRQLALSAAQRVAGVQCVDDNIQVAIIRRNRRERDATVRNERPLLALEPAAD